MLRLLGIAGLMTLLGCTVADRITSMPVPRMRVIGELKTLTFTLDAVTIGTNNELVNLCFASCQFEYRLWDMKAYIDFKGGELVCSCVKKKRARAKRYWGVEDVVK